MHDSLIPIILAILAAIIGAVTQGKKKTFSPPPAPGEESDMPRPSNPMPEAEVIIKRFLGEFIPEPVPVPAEPKSVTQNQPLNEDLVVPDELKRQRELLMAVEGLSSIPSSSFSEDEIHDDIAATQIRDASEETGNKPFIIKGVGTWDIRKAVILSEILNRRTNF